MDKKRSRSVNWDEAEKQLLRFVLRDHTNVIENKAIDSKTIKLKNKAWDEVYKKFNELNVRHRNIIQLKIQWKTMKLKARKRRKIKRELSDAIQAASNDAVIEIKEISNPAETLKQNNLNPMAFVDTCINDNIIRENQQIVDCIETIDNIDAQLDDQRIYTPLLRVSKDIFKVPQMEKDMGTTPVKKVYVPIQNGIPTIPENVSHNKDCIETIKNIDAHLDDQRIYTPLLRVSKDIFTVPQMEKNMFTAPVKKLYVPIQNGIPNITENISHNKDHDDHVTCILSHIKTLKDEEHRRRLEMAEEEHSLKIAIQLEKLKSATIEREILELKQAREVKLNLSN